MRWIIGILVGLAVMIIVATRSWAAGQPGSRESAAMKRVKYWRNPLADKADILKEAAEHFQHHCQTFHGVDGQSTGVPTIDKVSPPVRGPQV